MHPFQELVFYWTAVLCCRSERTHCIFGKRIKCVLVCNFVGQNQQDACLEPASSNFFARKFPGSVTATKPQVRSPPAHEMWNFIWYLFFILHFGWMSYTLSVFITVIDQTYLQTYCITVTDYNIHLNQTFTLTTEAGRYFEKKHRCTWQCRNLKDNRHLNKKRGKNLVLLWYWDVGTSVS